MSLVCSKMVWQINDLAPVPRLVLLCLADFADDAGCRIYPSIDLVSRNLEISRRTVQRALRDLEARGYLVRVGGGVNIGRGRAILYRLDKDRVRADMRIPWADFRKAMADQGVVDRSQKGDTGDVKGDTGDAKGDMGDVKGDTGDTLSVKKCNNRDARTRARGRDGENKKQKRPWEQKRAEHIAYWLQSGYWGENWGYPPDDNELAAYRADREREGENR